MNVLFSLDNYDHGSGGAEASARDLARHLATRGHTVEVLQLGARPRSYDDGAVRVHTRPLLQRRPWQSRERRTLAWNQQWRSLLAEFLKARQVDLVVTQAMLMPATVAVAAERGLPAAVFVRAYRAFCPTQFRDRDPLRDCTGHCLRCLPWHRRLATSALRASFDEQERGLREATVVFANSRYVQQVIRKFLAIEAEVVYPTADLAHYAKGGSSGDAVLFVKPQLVKGFRIFLELARRKPDMQFIVAGKLRSRVRRTLGGLANVELLGWVDDMSAVYARSRVLLGPSLWPEPFGRVFVEAGACGVPSVASARGGIPEAVGDGGILIDDVFDIDRWIAALRKLEEPSEWAAYSARAREHAQHFSAEAAAGAFLDGIRKATGLEL